MWTTKIHKYALKRQQIQSKYSVYSIFGHFQISTHSPIQWSLRSFSNLKSILIIVIITIIIHRDHDHDHHHHHHDHHHDHHHHHHHYQHHHHHHRHHHHHHQLH